MKFLRLLTTNIWRSTKNAKKIGVVWGVRGHPRSSETSPFDRTHDFLFDFNRNYAFILYRFRVIECFSSKLANFNPPHLHLSHHMEWSRSNFAMIFGNRKLAGLSCGIICVIVRLAILIQYRSVTDTHTDGQTDRHTTMAYTALSIASRGKNHEDSTLLDLPQRELVTSCSHCLAKTTAEMRKLTQQASRAE